MKDAKADPPARPRHSDAPGGPIVGDGTLRAASVLFYISGTAFLVDGLLNLAALIALHRLKMGSDAVPGALYPILHTDGWLFSLLCVLSFSLMGVIGIAAGRGFQKRIYWARSMAVSFSLMAASSGMLVAIYASLIPGLLLSALFFALLFYLFISKPLEKVYPVWVSRYGRSASQFSLLFLINATAFGSLIVAPLLPLLRFRHMAGGQLNGVPLCSIGSISRSLSGNWADLLLAPVALIAVLMLVGILVGRALCGWACPIGFLQDLGARTKAAFGLGDIELSRKGHERLKLIKYAVLLFVLILAVDIGISTYLSPEAHNDFISGMTGFPLYQSGATPCEACPAPITGYFFPDDLIKHGLAGTFVMTPEAALRIFVLIGFVIGAFVMPRFYCRYFCPAGAMASLFNRASAMSIEKDQEKCTECNYCVTACPMRVHRLKEEHVDSRVHDMECTFCLECIDSCPERALSLSFQGRTIYKGGKEWWLRTLKQTEKRTGEGNKATGSRQRAAGDKGGGSRQLAAGDGQQSTGSGQATAGTDGNETSGRRVQAAGNDGVGKGGAGLLVVLLLSMALVPLMTVPSASAGQYDAQSFPPRDAAGNYSLGSRDAWTIHGAQVTINGTVILNEEASIVIDGGAKVTIVGDLWLAGRSSVNVVDSQLTVNVPEQPPMKIEQLYSAPNGFVLIDEGAAMSFSNSKLRLARLQETLMHGIVQPSGAAGSGESFTYQIRYADGDNRPLSSINVVIDGVPHNMSKIDQNDTSSRDGIDYFFASTLSPGNHTYHFEGAGPDGPLRYPRQGENPGPHVGTDMPVFLFGSELLVNFGSFGAVNSSLDLAGSFYTHMSSRMELAGSSLNAGLTIEINPTCVFRESNIPSMVVKERTGRLNVFLYDCTVQTALMESFSNVLFERCTVTNLDMQSNSVTTVIQSTVNHYTSGGNASAYLDNARILAEDFPFMRIAGDSQATAYNGTTMGRVHLDNNGRLYLTSATVDILEACNEARVWSEYANIKKYELVDNATILNTLKVRATLNGGPAPVKIEVFSPGGDLLVATSTREDGFRSFAVPIRVITGSGSQVIDSCTINISYRSLKRAQEFSLKNGSSELNVSLEDRDPPRPSNIKFDYYYRSRGEALVTVDASDGQGSGVDSVILRYSMDGKKWEQRPLMQVGPSRYQGSIGGLKSASSLKYKVVATDWLNNTGSSPEMTEALGIPASTMAAAAVASVTILFVVGFVVLVIRYRKTKRYLDGKRPRSEET